jgi:Flp pilus assembly protein CpaB
MAEEERGGIQNVWLLFIALGLGLVVVVIYNVHIYKVRQEGRGQSIRLLSVTRDMERGDKIGPDDLVVKVVPKLYENTLGNVVPEDNQKYAVGRVMNETINKGQWLMWSHITEVDIFKPAYSIGPGNVALGVSLDARSGVPGDILRPNDLVNIVGVLQVQGSAMKNMRIIEGVRVLAIGGQGLTETKGERTAKAAPPARSYRNITVELPKDISLEFKNVLTHVSGDCSIELLSSRVTKSPTFGRINPLLKDLAVQPTKPLKAADYDRD